MSLQLRRPAAEWVASYLAFLDEIAALGERVWPTRPLPPEMGEYFVLRFALVELPKRCCGRFC